MLDTQGLQLYLVNHSVYTVGGLSRLRKILLSTLTALFLQSARLSDSPFLIAEVHIVYQVEITTTSEGACEIMQPPAMFLHCVVDQKLGHLPTRDTPLGNL